MLYSWPPASTKRKSSKVTLMRSLETNLARRSLKAALGRIKAILKRREATLKRMTTRKALESSNT